MLAWGEFSENGCWVSNGHTVPEKHSDKPSHVIPVMHLHSQLAKVVNEHAHTTLQYGEILNSCMVKKGDSLL